MSQSSHQHSTFTDNGIPVNLPPELDRSALQSFPAYQTWRRAIDKSLSAQRDPTHPFHQDPYTLNSITIQSCDFFGGERLGFLKLKASITNSANERIPGSVFMRGGSVAMLIILQSSDNNSIDTEDHVLLTVQPRIPAGSLSFIELPAGMIDDSGTFTGAAAKEIREETGLDIQESELVDLTRLAISANHDSSSSSPDKDGDDEPHLQQAIYPSPGGSDEFIPILMARKKMPAREIEAMKGKLTGLRDSGEKITLKVCLLKNLWKVAARDGKTLAAVALYEGLKREGRI